MEDWPQILWQYTMQSGSQHVHVSRTQKVGMGFGTLAQAVKTWLQGWKSSQLNTSSIADTLEQCKWRACSDVHQERRYNSILRIRTDHHTTLRKHNMAWSQHVHSMEGCHKPKWLAQWHNTSCRAGTNRMSTTQTASTSQGWHQDSTS